MKRTAQDEDAMPRRGYPYARYSQTRQGEGDSERRQRDWPKEVCAEQDWIYDDTYALIDKGKSGFHKKNLAPTAGLTRFLNLVKEKVISPGSVLIIENIDRLSRADVDTAHDLFRSIIRAGIWICTRTPFRIYKGDKDASFMDLLEPIWIMYCAYMESLKKSERIGEAWKEAHRAADRGEPIPGRPPTWIRRTPSGYELIEERAETIRRMFTLAREGFGYSTIIQHLETENRQCFGFSKRWNEPFIAKILRGRIVLGEYQVGQWAEGKHTKGGKVIPGFYPPVVEESEWLVVQAAIANRTGKRGRPNRQCINLFTGLLRDTDSGLSLGVHSKNYKSKKFASGLYYLATKKRGGMTIQYQGLEGAILDAVKELLPQSFVDPADQNGERLKKILSLDSHRANLVREEEGLAELIAKMLQVGKKPEALERKYEAVLAEQEKVARELAREKLEMASGGAEALNQAQNLIDEYRKAEGEEKFKVAQQLKTSLQNIFTGIEVTAQRLNARRQITTVRMILRRGEPRVVVIAPPPKAPRKPWRKK